MYNATVSYLNSYEYFDIESFDKLDQTDICEMCDGYHGDNSMCQMGDE